MSNLVYFNKLRVLSNHFHTQKTKKLYIIYIYNSFQKRFKASVCVPSFTNTLKDHLLGRGLFNLAIFLVTTIKWNIINSAEAVNLHF